MGLLTSSYRSPPDDTQVFHRSVTLAAGSNQLIHKRHPKFWQFVTSRPPVHPKKRLDLEQVWLVSLSRFVFFTQMRELQKAKGAWRVHSTHTHTHSDNFPLFSKVKHLVLFHFLFYPKPQTQNVATGCQSRAQHKSSHTGFITDETFFVSPVHAMKYLVQDTNWHFSFNSQFQLCIKSSG